ncbi:MAG: hypothetical protein K6B41_09935, partial [Butyrivibrio sp.]|nr:hypothetical protein [Butyrivibrio sp.]
MKGKRFLTKSFGVFFAVGLIISSIPSNVLASEEIKEIEIEEITSSSGDGFEKTSLITNGDFETNSLDGWNI